MAQYSPSSARPNDSMAPLEPPPNDNSSQCCPSVLKVCVAGDASPNAAPKVKAAQSTPATTHTPSTILLKRAGAEFVGTFLLIFAVEGSIITNEKTNGGLTYMGVALASGLAVMIIILSTGHISGAHLNPAVTLAFAAINEFPWPQVPIYFVSQLVASIVAALAVELILQCGGSAGLTVPSGTAPQAFVVELIITFCLMFVITAVATDTRAVGEQAGMAVGATVILNNLMAGAITGASMNPVRTLGPAIVASNYTAVWVYILGPITGALAGAATYTLVRFNNPDGSLGGRRSIRRELINYYQANHPAASTMAPLVVV